MGESIFEGTITKWLKKAGDAVEKDEPLFEISTDKVDAEIPSPVAGVLTAINFPEGATVVVDTVVAIISESALYQGTTSVVPQTLQTNDRALAPEGELSAPPSASHAVASPHQEAPPPEAPAKPPRSSPLVRRMAKDNHLDLRQIAGSGSEGRITKEDVMRHLNEHSPSSETSPAPPQVAQVVPLTKMRAIIAQRMVESVRISPHVHTVYKVDMTRIALLREREKARFEQQHGVKLTYMPFIAAAAVQALVKFSIVNASLIDGFLHYHPQINLGIAVALEWGLIVPVVKQAEGRSFLELTRAIADLAERARSKKLLPDEVQGGTFTLTNSGVFGGEFGTPILNQPESAILAIGGLHKEPVVLTDAEGNDTIAIRSMQHFCLGFDHRLIDGAEAGRFMSVFKQTLEAWDKPIG
jgi:2-oxoglutarate dehydrogenase E2 component (dihydrolipoamide succinyltransferase)